MDKLINGILYYRDIIIDLSGCYCCGVIPAPHSCSLRCIISLKISLFYAVSPCRPCQSDHTHPLREDAVRFFFWFFFLLMSHNLDL